MASWVYKCNEKAPYDGNWDYVFDRESKVKWGDTSFKGVSKLQPGDQIIAYQTDRSEIVGVAEVVTLRPREEINEVIMRRVERIGANVELLKQDHPAIEKIPAFQPGFPKTGYEISPRDARTLLEAARKQVLNAASEAKSRAATVESSDGESYTAWRMAFRAGNGGEELWDKCLRHGVAAIHYGPMVDTDLSKFSLNALPASWKKLRGSQKPSLKAVGYEMKTGDVIYVKQGKYIVG